jgi:hypothetical protein
VGGRGNAARIGAYEEWRFGEGELSADSRGHFGEADQQRQLKGGA